MRYFFHGEDSRATREKLNELKCRFETLPLIVFSPSTVAFNQELLFSQPKFYLLEFFEKNELRIFSWPKFFRFLDSGPDEVFAIWSNFEVSLNENLKTLYRKYLFQEVRINSSNLVFKTVDSFFNGNRDRPNFYGLINSWSSQEILFLVQMLIKRTRMILWRELSCQAYDSLKGFTRKVISESLPQATPVEILGLYWSLLDLERRVKTNEDDLLGRLLTVYENFHS